MTSAISARSATGANWIAIPAQAPVADGERPDAEALEEAVATPWETSEAMEATDATVVTVASATGGCGKTFFATSLAAMLGRAGRRVLLVDLDLQFGEVAAALQLRPQYSIYDGLYSAKGKRLPDEVFGEHLGELTVKHRLGFDVLTAPRDPALADYVGARDADHVLDTVVPLYDVVVVDTPPALNEVVVTVLDRSDVVVTIAALDIPSLKNLSVFLDMLRRLKIDDGKLQLVLNKVDHDLGIDVQQTQDAFGGRFKGLIPLSNEVSRAMNIGTVVTDSDPSGKVANSLVKIAREILPPHIAPPQLSDHGGSRGWWAFLIAALGRFTKGGSR